MGWWCSACSNNGKIASPKSRSAALAHFLIYCQGKGEEGDATSWLEGILILNFLHGRLLTSMLSSIAFTIYRIIWTSVSPYSNLKLHFNYKLISIYLRAHYSAPTWHQGLTWQSIVGALTAFVIPRTFFCKPSSSSRPLHCKTLKLNLAILIFKLHICVVV